MDRRRAPVLVAACLVAFGYALAITSTQFQGQVVRQIIEKLGLSLVTGGIAYGILKYLTEDVKDTIQESSARFHGSKREAGPEIDMQCLKATKRVDVIGISLEGFFSGSITPDRIIEKIRNGCHVRLLILDPASNAFTLRAQDEMLSEETHIDGFKRVRHILSDIEAGLRRRQKEWPTFHGSIQVCLFRSLPYFSYVRADDTLFLGFYNRNRQCNTSACIQLPRANKHFDAFVEDFNFLFGTNDNSSVLFFRGGDLQASSLPLPTAGFLGR